MTAPPKVIWPMATPLAIAEEIFIPLGDIFDLSVNAIVIITNNAVVAATVLWTYSIIKLYVGTRPAGHNGQFGQVKPTPEALTYPPMKISAKSEQRLATESVFSSFLVITRLSLYL
jgi:hypothetical protein